MSRAKLKGLIDYLNTVKEKYTTNKKETLLEIANYTYSYIENLEEKLKMAEEALQYYADGEDMSEAKMQGSDAWRYIVDDNHTDTAQQALQKMKEVNRC